MTTHILTDVVINTLKKELDISVKRWAVKWNGTDEAIFCKGNGMPSFIVARALNIPAKEMLKKFRQLEKLGKVIIVSNANQTKVWPKGYINELRSTNEEFWD